MKKKIIICLLLALCIVCLSCTLAGCSSNTVKYVNSSFNVTNLNCYPSIEQMSVTYEFKLSSTATRDVKCKYVIAVKNSTTGKIAFTREYEYNGEITKNETITISEYVSFYKEDYAAIKSLMENATIELMKIDITEIDLEGVNEQYDGYAIGFGVTSAVLLLGLIALLIVDKLRN